MSSLRFSMPFTKCRVEPLCPPHWDCCSDSAKKEIMLLPPTQPESVLNPDCILSHYVQLHRCHRPGHDEHPFHCLRPLRTHRCLGAERARTDLPPARVGRTRR